MSENIVVGEGGEFNGEEIGVLFLSCGFISVNNNNNNNNNDNQAWIPLQNEEETVDFTAKFIKSKEEEKE